MDNRLGERVSVQCAVRLMSTRPRAESIGQLRNLSRSGAFVAAPDLQLFSLLHVAFEALGRPKQDEDTIVAYVTRVCDEGIGIEWCEFAPPVVCELLRMSAATADESTSEPSDGSADERLPVLLLLNQVS